MGGPVAWFWGWAFALLLLFPPAQDPRPLTLGQGEMKPGLSQPLAFGAEGGGMKGVGGSHSDPGGSLLFPGYSNHRLTPASLRSRK